jgi:predicted kinase
MEAIIFTGIQAAGKSTYFKQHFFDTHVRINLDMLRTRNREALLLSACLQAKQKFVVDNTNPTPLDRARYIGPAKAVGFRVVSYYFEVDMPGSIARNAARIGNARIPVFGIHSTRRKMQAPSADEGFDEMYVVRLLPSGDFDVQRIHPPPEQAGT